MENHLDRSPIISMYLVLCALSVSACGGGGGGNGSSQVTDPNVAGDTQAAATTAITAAGLTVGTITMQTSSTVPAGDIISENPAAGSSLSSGSAVSLIVSSGPAEVSVPNVVGDTQATATTAITGAGLVVGTVTQQSSSTVVSGSVISENPAAGANVASGSTVNFVISTGQPKVAVPNVVGNTQATATTAITGAGLMVGTIAQQSSSTVVSGSVISESPAAGTYVAGGSTVDLVVSTGQPNVAVPNVIGDTQASATTAITGADLAVGSVTQQSSNSVASGSVISQSPVAGADVPSGSAVALVISSGPASDAGYTVGGTISGLTSDGLVLGSTLGSGFGVTASPVAGATSFTMPGTYASGTGYRILLDSQPAGETCVVANGTGTIGSSNITSVAITCSSGQWVQVSQLPVTCTNVSVAALNGSLYVLGGVAADNTSYSYCDNFESYDPSTMSWTTLPVYPSPPGGPYGVTGMALVAINDSLYSFGGFYTANHGGTASLAWSYSTASGWTELPPTNSMTSDPSEGQIGAMGVTTDGTLAYLVGGEFTTGYSCVLSLVGGCDMSMVASTYNPSTNEYALLPNFSDPLLYPALAWHAGNLVVVPGSPLLACPESAYIYVYDPSAGSGTPVGTPFPPGSNCGASSWGAVVGSTFYVSYGGGQGLVSYDLTTNSWTTLGPLPCSTTCTLGPLAAINGVLYVVVYGAAGEPAQLWSFTP